MCRHPVFFPPRVDWKHDPDEEDIAAEANQSRKRKLWELSAMGPTSTFLQRAWLRKSKRDGTKTRRPKTVHRLGANRYGQILDNQLKVSTPFDGFVAVSAVGFHLEVYACIES